MYVLPQFSKKANTFVRKKRKNYSIWSFVHISALASRQEYSLSAAKKDKIYLDS